MLTFKNFYIGGGSHNQWTVLRHNGPMFPPEYEKHNVPVIINNEKIILPIKAEEYATMFAKFVDTKYMEISNFKKNFWKDFKPTLENIKVESLDQIDFSLIKKSKLMAARLIHYGDFFVQIQDYTAKRTDQLNKSHGTFPNFS